MQRARPVDPGGLFLYDRPVGLALQSGLFCGEQGDQCVLLATTHFTEAQQQFALWLVQFFHALITECLARWEVGQGGQIQQAVFKPRDDFRVHAAVMLFGNFCDAVTHAFGEADDKFVGCSTGVVLECSFHGQQ